MADEIVNPIARFYLQGLDDDNESVAAYVDFYGENGEQTKMKFTRPGESGALAEMLWECALDLAEAQTYGILRVVERRGSDDEDETLTVEDILNPDPNNVADNGERNKSIIYPWEEYYKYDTDD